MRGLIVVFGGLPEAFGAGWPAGGVNDYAQLWVETVVGLGANRGLHVKVFCS